MKKVFLILIVIVSIITLGCKRDVVRGIVTDKKTKSSFTTIHFMRVNNITIPQTITHPRKFILVVDSTKSLYVSKVEFDNIQIGDSIDNGK